MEVDWGEPAHLRGGQASDTPPAHIHWAKVSFIYTLFYLTLVTKSTSSVRYLPTQLHSFLENYINFAIQYYRWGYYFKEEKQQKTK